MSTGQSRPWRAACREHAAHAALAEARSLWAAHEDKPLPFSHRWEHVQEVVRLALWLCRVLGADTEIVEAAAWLHDVCKQEPRHAEAGAAEAQRFLPQTDFPPAKRAAVVEAIREHEGFFREPGALPLDPLETAVLWDADKLSKLGVQAIAYTAGTPYAAGMTLAQRRDFIDSFARSVLSRTVQSMNTAPGRNEAIRRFDDMMRALDAWAHEEELGVEAGAEQA